MLSKVSIVKCGSYEVKKIEIAIRESLKLINFKIPKNKKILLKPNLLGSFGEDRNKAIVTNPNIIKAVANIFKDNKLFLGDSSAQMVTEKVLRESKIKEISEKSGIKVVNFDKSEKIEEDFNGRFLKRQHISRIIKDVDLIINLPKLKTHSLTTYTGAIKNLFGIIPGSRKSKLHNITKTEENFSEMLVDILKLIKPGLNIMDGIIGMDGNGPSMGNFCYSNVILTSENAVALDIAATKLIGFNSEEITAIKIGKKEKLVDEVGIIGEKDLRLEYKRPSSRFFFKRIPRPIKAMFFDEKKFEVDKLKCKKCGICKKVCPVNAISYDPYPVWDFKKCIRCHCCFESCPYNAIKIKDSLMFRLYVYLSRRIKKK